VAFDMVNAQPPELFMKTIPGHYAGRYRGKYNFEFKENGKVLKECLATHSDLYDID
jgi:hypothetical protein